ncbi:hypothetical protein [Clavibacter phaseoli]|nr:hypothetical protein [Clavibacter phaseoli]
MTSVAAPSSLAASQLIGIPAATARAQHEPAEVVLSLRIEE